MNYLLVFCNPKEPGTFVAEDTGTPDRGKALALARRMVEQGLTSACSVVQHVGGFSAKVTTLVVEHTATGAPIDDGLR